MKTNNKFKRGSHIIVETSKKKLACTIENVISEDRWVIKYRLNGKEMDINPNKYKISIDESAIEYYDDKVNPGKFLMESVLNDTLHTAPTPTIPNYNTIENLGLYGIQLRDGLTESERVASEVMSAKRLIEEGTKMLHKHNQYRKLTAVLSTVIKNIK